MGRRWPAPILPSGLGQKETCFALWGYTNSLALERSMQAKSRDPDINMPLYPDLKDKVAIVTGGSSGIGLATAKAFARQGTQVVIARRKEAAAKSALKILAKAGDVRWLPVDVADGKSVSRLIKGVVSAHGRLDYAFNNGGSG